MELFQKIIKITFEPCCCIVSGFCRYVETALRLHVYRLSFTVVVQIEFVEFIRFNDLNGELRFLFIIFTQFWQLVQLLQNLQNRIHRVVDLALMSEL